MVEEILRRSGLSQAELARRAGMPRSVVNVYARGRREPGAVALARLAAAAGFDLRLALRRPLGEKEVAQLLPELLDSEKLFAVHDSLRGAGLRHAFGGAVSCAYYTGEPRPTRDLDVNVFVDRSRAETALAGLPEEIAVSAEDVEAATREGQRRLWWGDTPVDVFLDSLPLHTWAAARVVWFPLVDREIPVLDCASLVAFKASIGRPKDWTDIEAIASAERGRFGRG